MNNLFETISKPTLLLDELKARKNIADMAIKARRSNVVFRPHFKTHQSMEIGTWFWDEGVRAITVSSLDMADYFARTGWMDITLAFPINIRQLTEITDLSERISLGVLVENLDALRAITSTSAKIKIWVKIDTGLGRTGIPFDRSDQLRSVLDEVKKFPNVTVEGLLTHAGQTYSAHSSEEAVRIHREASQRMIRLRDAVDADHLKLSVGDTPGCSLMSDFPGIDEIRPGNFVFYDAEQWEIGSCDSNQIAVALACPVVARHPERNEVVLYGGAIHFSKESFVHTGKPSYGLAVSPQLDGWGDFISGCSVTRLSQEHGILAVPDQYINRFQIGNLAFVVPAHSCLTAHLMRHYLTTGGKTIEMMPI